MTFGSVWTYTKKPYNREIGVFLEKQLPELPAGFPIECYDSEYIFSTYETNARLRAWRLKREPVEPAPDACNLPPNPTQADTTAAAAAAAAVTTTNRPSFRLTPLGLGGVGRRRR